MRRSNFFQEHKVLAVGFISLQFGGFHLATVDGGNLAPPRAPEIVVIP